MTETLRVPASEVRIGDKLLRHSWFHPVEKVELTTHPLVIGEVVKITHDLGSLSMLPSHVCVIERTNPETTKS